MDGRGARALMLAACAAVVSYGIHFWSPVLVPVLLSLCVAAAGQPVFEGAQKRGAPSYLAAALAMLVVMGAVFGFAVLMAVAGNELADSLPKYERAIHQFQTQAAIELQQHHLTRLSVSVARFDFGKTSTAAAEGMLSSAAGIFGNVALVLVLAAFFMLERAVFYQKLSRIPSAPRARDVFHRALGDVQKYLWLKTLMSGATGILAGALCAALDVPNAVLWGLVAFALNYAPNVGSLVAAILPVGLTLILRGPQPAAALAAGYLVINVVIGNVVEPKVMGQKLGLSPLVVVVAMVAWGFLLGPVGALLSTPLTMVFKITVGHSDDLRWVSRLLGNFSEARDTTEPPLRGSLAPREAQ